MEEWEMWLPISESKILSGKQDSQHSNTTCPWAMAKQDEYFIAQVEKIPFNKRDAMLQQIMCQFTLTKLLSQIHKMPQCSVMY